MADLGIGADLDQVHHLRMEGDEINPERLVGERLGGCNFGGKDFNRHRPAGNHAEATGVGDGGNQIALADPGHRACHDGMAGAKERRTARHQCIEAGHAAASRP